MGEMLPLLEEIYSSRKVYDASGEAVSVFPTSIPCEEGMALYQLVKTAKPDTTLEIGMAYGVSTLFICQALRENGHGRHIVIDPYQTTPNGWKSIGLLNLERAGMRELVTFHEDSSHAALPRVLAEGTRVQMAFIDGSHRFADVLLDLYFTDKLLDVGGCMVFDDLWFVPVRKALAFALRNMPYRLAHELHGAPVSLPMQCKRFARTFLHNPFGAYLFGGIAPGWGLHHLRYNYAVVRKLELPPRSWEFFANF
ncbi:MAG: O-methyltransferase [bacterium ADurb.Bin429]|nr:MAG: O-methyltransferase [bacterium ADurb.Bin429]